MQDKFNVYEKINSGSQGLRKMNISPMTKEAAIKLANYWRDRAVGKQKYLILQQRHNSGYEVNSVRTY
jgi:hypothetical protein